MILVGHSYGGAVITEAGTDPNVKALVYIAAFAPDGGESVQTLIADLPAETICVSQPGVVADLVERVASEVASPAMTYEAAPAAGPPARLTTG